MHVSVAPHDEISWINHAGYQLQTGQVRLVCDPWLTGPAFDRGWDLLVPSRFSTADLSRATHIWFSHEHPDHFSPVDIRQIDSSRRGEITILFQKTRDRRVASFCAKLGFKVRELDPGVPFDIAPGVRCVIGVVDVDSWLHLETPTHTYLNVNDCILSSTEHFNAIGRASSRSLDVLLTQFSYANWAGNRGDSQQMRAEADDKLREMRRIVEYTRPRFLIPFASYVFFSNTENFYLNEGANAIGDIFNQFDTPERPCIVLYPGDVWAPETPHDSLFRIAQYDAARAAISPRHAPPPVPFDTLQQLAADCAQRLATHNHLWAIRLMERSGMIAPLIVHLDDLGMTIAYRPGRELEVVAATRPDVSCSADAFAQCLRVDYGVDTLLVNGRFQVGHPKGRLRLSRAFGINRHNSRGIGFPWGLLSARLRESGLPRPRGARPLLRAS